ncbi:HCLS1-associated protein X-1 [Diprion similis]|uniref:HCLS1-associated protein X-1 n=1 Tax=Diprion similis TaxID=362088 RepID=UPI001EF97299|nr:HCLS1-associated protein X-1 [Diprion similis]
MSFYNYLRDLFNFGGRQNQQNNQSQYGFEDQWQHGHEFRNPIWQTDEDDDDDNDDFRQRGQQIFGSGHFNIHSNPFEITQYFERQLDNMLKNFFGFSQDGIMLPFGNEAEGHFQDPMLIEPPKRENLRDEVLKPGYESYESKNFHTPVKEKLDVNLDGKITSEELSQAWKDLSSLQRNDADTNISQQRPFSFHSFGQSISTKIIRKPDGSIEQYRTVRDSEGNEETTVTRQVGDKSHTVIVKKGKNGEKTETEFVNPVNPIEPNPEQTFVGIWDDQRQQQSPLSTFPWHKFFGPKL